MNEDNDLKTLFQAQRAQVRQQAPAWRGVPQGAASTQAVSHRPLWLWLTTSAAMVVLGLGIWMQTPAPEPKLSEALPVLLDTPGTPLFAGLDETTSTPSDLFLPVHLQLRLP